MKKTIISEQYKIKVALDGVLVRVKVYELRKGAKVFKYKYIGTKLFWIDDFPSIDRGVNKAFLEVISQDEIEKAREEKIKNYF